MSPIVRKILRGFLNIILWCCFLVGFTYLAIFVYITFINPDSMKPSFCKGDGGVWSETEQRCLCDRNHQNPEDCAQAEKLKAAGRSEI